MDGTGSQTVYEEGRLNTIPNEENNLRFTEPYLLAASANEDGQVGSQFFITMTELPALNGSKHTIFGRLLKGTRTLHQIAQIDEIRRIKTDMEKLKDKISDNATLENAGLLRKKRTYIEKDADIIIRNSGVYKFGKDDIQRRTTSAAGKSDFVPLDFMESRKKK